MADMKTSCTRSSASPAGTRASKMPCTMSAYFTYNSPKAPRSPSAAARIRPSSCSTSLTTNVIITGAPRLLEHRIHVARAELLHGKLGVQTIDAVRAGLHQRVGELFAVLAHQ